MPIFDEYPIPLSSLEVHTKPSAEPVTLAEAKTHLRVEHSDSNDEITALITAARESIDGPDGMLNTAIMTQVWDYRVTEWAQCIAIPLYPAVSIGGIYYLDPDEQSPSELSVSNTSLYRLIPGRPAVLFFNDNFTYPTILSQPQNVRIRFTAGYTSAANVPAPIKQAIKLIIGHNYANREPVIIGQTAVEVPMSAKYLLAPYRMIR